MPFIRTAYCSLRNEMERNETKRNEMKICSLRNENLYSLQNENLQFAKWKSAVCEIWIFGAVANVRTIEENYPLGRHSDIWMINDFNFRYMRNNPKLRLLSGAPNENIVENHLNISLLNVF